MIVKTKGKKIDDKKERFLGTVRNRFRFTFFVGFMTVPCSVRKKLEKGKELASGIALASNLRYVKRSYSSKSCSSLSHGPTTLLLRCLAGHCFWLEAYSGAPGSRPQRNETEGSSGSLISREALNTTTSKYSLLIVIRSSFQTPLGRR